MKKLLIFVMTTALVGIAYTTPGYAHKLRESGEAVEVTKADIVVVPSRDWNRLNGRIGKRAETWTIDGPQLNDVTFYGGIEPGEPLVKERNKKRDPLPKFSANTLLVEVPELLEGTYRNYKRITSFKLISAEPGEFLGRDGVHFAYDYIDQDLLIRRGEARAAIIDGALYMVTFDAPVLHYFDKAAPDFRKLADSATLE